MSILFIGSFSRLTRSKFSHFSPSAAFVQRFPCTSFPLNNRSVAPLHVMTQKPNRVKPPMRGPPQKKKKRKNEKAANEGSTEQVLQLDVTALLKKHQKAREQDDVEKIASVVYDRKCTEFPETEVTILQLSSTGDGLALSPSCDHVYAVPFTVPGDTVRVKVVKTVHDESYSLTDLLEVIKKSPERNDSLINCQYFGKCSGCQLQMLPYEDQLRHKKRIIEKAYANFSGILPELVPAIRDTMGSPLQYGYRTKLTPHFPRPSGIRKDGTRDNTVRDVPPIGYNMKGRSVVIDIEDCPLGTDILRRGLRRERKRVADNIHTYSNGATLLLRESTTRKPKSENGDGTTVGDGPRPRSPTPRDIEDVLRIEHANYIEEKRCITDHKANSFEYVDDYLFQNTAGQFFQNNNSILSPFTSYIREQSHPTPSTSKPTPKIKYLLDAYSGSGLFTVTLSPLFVSSLGIDISNEGIIAARENARANNLPNTGFAAADAAHLFKDVPYPPDQTLLVIDPPRKGCDNNFLQQLLSYKPVRVVYVSCNVHTQARDVGVLVQGGKGIRYEIESIRGFDFFPQTGHVESVAVLNRVDTTNENSGETTSATAAGAGNSMSSES